MNNGKKMVKEKSGREFSMRRSEQPGKIRIISIKEPRDGNTKSHTKSHEKMCENSMRNL